MNLNDLLQTIKKPMYAAVFSVGMAASTLGACGDEVNNYYGDGGNGGNPSGACGNSPFVGNYVWEIRECEMGSTRQFNPTTCSVELFGDNHNEGGLQVEGLLTSRGDSFSFSGYISGKVDGGNLVSQGQGRYFGAGQMDEFLLFTSSVPYAGTDDCRERF